MSARTQSGRTRGRPGPIRGHSHFLQHRFKLRRVPALPCCDHDGHGFLALLDGQVQLGGEPAARASQSVIPRLGENTARWFLLQVTPLASPGRMLMSAAHGGVEAQIPSDQALDVGQGLEPGKDPLPGSVPLPSAKQVVDPIPRPVLDRHVPPRHTGPDPKPS